MAEIVNLREWRKKMARNAAEAKAEQNRSAFGQSKLERARRDFLKGQTARHLDQHHVGKKPDESG